MGVLCGRPRFCAALNMPKGSGGLSTFFDYVSKGLDAAEARAELARREWPLLVYNLTDTQKAAYVAEVLRGIRPGLILTYSEEQALKWVNDLRTLLPGEPVLYFPVTEWLPFEFFGRSRETTAQRVDVLNRLAWDCRCTVVAPILAVERRLFRPKRWRKHCLQFKVGQAYDVAATAASLVVAGYERVEVVEGTGQFALRGGIMDIAPLAGEPLRLEFFDDEVDSIRNFALDTQKSVGNLNEALVAPVLEYALTREELEQLRWEVRIQARRAGGRLLRTGRNEAARRLEEKARQLEERLSQGILDENLYGYLSLVPEPLVDFYAYLPADAAVILDEPLRLKEQLDFQERERVEEFTRQLEQGEAFVNPESQFIIFPDVLRTGSRPLLALSTLPRQVPGLNPRGIFNPTVRPITGAMGKTSALAEEIQHLLNLSSVVALFAGDKEHSSRLVQGLKDRGLMAQLKTLGDELQPGNAYVFPLSLDRGFELPFAKLAVFTETEIYRRERKAPLKTKDPGKAKAILRVSDLKPGDFVVHVYHGIGQFTGIERLNVGGVDKDYFAIRYAGQDRLYVPLDQLHLVQKYLGADSDAAPKLSKLGGTEWNKVKSKARSAVKELALDLMKLYAEREAAPGFAFSPDNVWQREFEDKFPYEETPDQLQCIQEVKADMMRPRPMDRLLCGDVGYGKTEVALRAAFKAVLDSKQVAVLVPTTILAQQHFNTFRERFMGYPVVVEMLSRFRTPKEQKQILKGLSDGSIDIVIGTHKLVADTVKFKDLGLLIVDEEQRFGVAHKEKLKALKTSVDVLTLSATPIPRTLHMSLVGVRDMSVIETPPEDRYPVQTYVAEYRGDLVRDAIRREIQRGGQVFYVHNRVEDLEQVLHFLGRLVPEARFGIAHGQMSEAELERVIMSFLEREIDVLISTTIIETGLDMPNVNTLIVDEADRLGLAQLYQLRGRVGRSNRKAFAYFLYKPQKVLTEVAEKRLMAIREFTEFGSGFRIAMRDLEIRGAGSLIGAQQHGHLAAVGFDLYCQMLKEAVQELRGEKIEDLVEPSVELQVDAFLPDEYIADPQTKVSLYQRIVLIKDEDSLSEIIDELVDRFGTPPREVENLLQIVRIKWQAQALRIEQIQQAKQYVTLRFAGDPGLTGEELMAVAVDSPYPLAFSTADGGNLECKIRLRLTSQEEILKAVNHVLRVFTAVAAARRDKSA